MKENIIDYQLAPPGMHRLNSEERDISTFKDHFITVLCAAYPYFLMQNWECLLEQADITLNLLCPSGLNPRLSAYAQMNGEFYLSLNPMESTEKKILVHYKPHNICTWAPHVHKGWYVSPTMLHNRCLTSYIPNMDKYRVSITTDFLPATLIFPRISSKDAATHASADLAHALLNSSPTSPLTILGNKKRATLKQLA